MDAQVHASKPSGLQGLATRLGGETRAGSAIVMQAGAVRISGRIARELDGNGGINWDAEFKQMSDALLTHLGAGQPLPAPALREAAALVGEVKRKGGRYAAPVRTGGGVGGIEFRAHRLMSYAESACRSDQAIAYSHAAARTAVPYSLGRSARFPGRRPAKVLLTSPSCIELSDQRAPSDARAFDQLFR